MRSALYSSSRVVCGSHHRRELRLEPPDGEHRSTSGGPSSTGARRPAAALGPTVVIDSPLVGTLVNVGDSVLVDGHGCTITSQLQSATISGVTEAGSVDLGTYTQTLRYKAITVPRRRVPPGAPRHDDSPLPAADQRHRHDARQPRDLVIARTRPAPPTRRSVASTSSPAPRCCSSRRPNGDSIPAGIGLNVVGACHDLNGVGRIDIRVQGESNWPTELDTRSRRSTFTSPRDVTFAGAVARSDQRSSARPHHRDGDVGDVDRQPGSAAPVTAFVRSLANAAVPRVTQAVPAKSEYSDSVTVRATGNGITQLGLIIRDTTGVIVQTDTLGLRRRTTPTYRPTFASNLQPSLQGKRLGVTAFAIDQTGKTGYAVSSTTTLPQGNLTLARVDSTLVVYGQTFALPRQGTVGDLAVDAARGNVFLSNTNFNTLEVWHNNGTTKSFYQTGIPVGSLPWGLFIASNPDTLLVANSGGTNISRVYIGSTDPTQIHEDLPNRILTRNSYVYSITVAKDDNTGKIRLTAVGPISYSDRPQYIAQSAGGRIYYSTRPTVTAPAGTMRWIDPKLPVPDPRQTLAVRNVPPGRRADVRALQRRLDRHRRGTALVDGLRHTFHLGPSVRSAQRRHRGRGHDPDQRRFASRGRRERRRARTAAGRIVARPHRHDVCDGERQSKLDRVR